MKFIIALLLVLSSCHIAVEEKNDAEEKINALMQAQEKAWNRGDLQAFMQPYWQSDSVLFIGQNGVQNGWQATLKNYQKTYGSKAAMGNLRFENTNFKKIDKTNAWVLGKWTLFRNTDTLSGYYTLLWQRKNGQWLIIADHSS